MFEYTVWIDYRATDFPDGEDSISMKVMARNPREAFDYAMEGVGFGYGDVIFHDVMLGW